MPVLRAINAFMLQEELFFKGANKAGAGNKAELEAPRSAEHVKVGLSMGLGCCWTAKLLASPTVWACRQVPTFWRSWKLRGAPG